MSAPVELRHYAGAAVSLDRGRTYRQELYAKPEGFWVSVLGEDDWPSWCRAEQYAVDLLAFEHEVTLATDAKILTLETPDAIRTFHGAYGLGSWSVDWAGVAERYDGIIIAPYQWSLRLNGPSWYYGWDVASGCIWNLDAITDVRVMERAA